jgi:hypothetical protein
MSRNGSGTYNLPAGNPVVTGTTISSTWANSTLSDIASALTGSIASDGQTTPSANLPMGTYAHTNVGNATVRNMYASAGQVQDNTAQYLTTVSGTDVITAAASFGMTGYVTGQVFTFIAAGTNTGATTLNINSIGAKAITKNGTTALAAGDIASGQAITVVYDGTQFQLGRVATPYTPPTDIAFVDVAQTFTASQRGTVTTDNDLSFDMSVTNNFSCTPTGSATLTFTNITAGQSGYVLLDNSGGYAITAATTTKVDANFLTTVSTAGVYLISYMSNGTNVYCTASGALS